MTTPPLTGEQLVGIGRDLLEVGERLTSSYMLATYGGPRPASEEAIEALKDVDGCDDQRECAICLNLLLAEKNQALKEMPCGHRFHGGCLEKWLRVQGTCRHQLPPAPQMTRAERKDAMNRWFADVQEFQERTRMYDSNTTL